jgi:hypothetical protein
VEKQLYIRVRGRVLGPYDQEKLQLLARRGQLSRMHEVSEDATAWVRASTYPELFVNDTLPAPAAPRDVSGEVGAPFKPEGQPQRTGGQRWWYNKNGSEAGPVDQATLQQLLSSGNLSPDDLVWTDGMTQWVPARQAPGLSPFPTDPVASHAGGGQIAGSKGQNGELSASLCRSATDSRSWVVFIAIISYVYAGLLFLSGILLLINGANHHLAPVVAYGLFNLIFAVDVAAGGCLLLAYANGIAALRYSRQPMALEKGLRTLHGIWLYVGINLIVFLAFCTVLVVWMISASGTFPWF